MLAGDLMNTLTKCLKSLLFSVVILIIPCNLQSLNVIFDLGDVLVETNSLEAFKQAGLKRFACYGLCNPLACNPLTLHTISKHIRYNRLFALIDAALPRSANEVPLR